MTIKGHAGWVVVLFIGTLYFGLRGNTGNVPGAGSLSCGAAWSSTESFGPCAVATSGAMQGSVALLVVTVLALIGLAARAAKAG